MPLAPRKLSVFYRQLAQQLAAGLPLAESLRAPSPAPSGDCFRLAELAESGQAVSAFLPTAGPWLPEQDIPFLIAGAQSGRLPQILAHLSDRHAQLHATRMRVALACAYPLAVFHFGALIFPFLRMIDFAKGFHGGLLGYLGGLAAILVPVWGGAALFYVLIRRRNPFALNVLDRMPAIGSFRKNQALADFSFALGHLLEAGLPIGQAWLEAGRIARSPRLLHASETISAAIGRGQAPSLHLAATQVFPPEFINRYRTGENTGSLDAALLALAADHQSQANLRLTVASMLYPALLFGAVALMVAYFVVSFYAGYFNSLNHIMDNN